VSDEQPRRGLTDLLFRWGSRRSHDASVSPPKTLPSKALPKFLAALRHRDAPVLVDLGPVVGANVSFLGENLGCKIFVEDIISDLERFGKEKRLAEFPKFLETRLAHADGSVDGILCWDVLDYLEKPAAQVLGRRLATLLKPGGALLGFFATSPGSERSYTRHVIVNQNTLEYRPFAGSMPRQPVIANRDVGRLFEGLRVVESFLLLTKTREILFRKPA
jgi:hypothetical protein